MKNDGITLEHAFVAGAGAYVAYKGLQGLGRLISSIPPEVWADAAAQIELNRLKESGDTEAFDALILSRLQRPLTIPVPLPSWLSAEEKNRLCSKIVTELAAQPTTTFKGLTSLPVVGPIVGNAPTVSLLLPNVASTRSQRQGKGGKKRNRKVSFPISTQPPKLLAPAPQAVDAKLRNNHKKRKVTGRHGGSKNRRTLEILELYDAARTSGRNDVGARAAAANKLPVDDRLDSEKALRKNTRSVDFAIRRHRSNGAWKYRASGDNFEKQI